MDSPTFKHLLETELGGEKTFGKDYDPNNFSLEKMSVLCRYLDNVREYPDKMSTFTSPDIIQGFFVKTEDDTVLVCLTRDFQLYDREIYGFPPEIRRLIRKAIPYFFQEDNATELAWEKVREVARASEVKNPLVSFRDAVKSIGSVANANLMSLDTVTHVVNYCWRYLPISQKANAKTFSTPKILHGTITGLDSACPDVAYLTRDYELVECNVHDLTNTMTEYLDKYGAFTSEKH